MWFWSVSWSTHCPVYFSFFLVDQRKICPVSDLFCSLSWIFCQVFFLMWFWSLGRPIVRSISHFLKKTGQKIQESEQKRSETGQFFLGWPKKWEIDRTIGRPRDWPKVHGRRFNVFWEGHEILQNMSCVVTFISTLEILQNCVASQNIWTLIVFMLA